ncbi:DUF3757 domain-containing protein [Yersinia aleksiciae]|uniref:Protein of uncharacterized function (DUF3757) n=1 Tax=Yersinia aleksiciae TaxID=263819 RepID=A0A0T9T3D1_YERAE|nr:DUF3757 domain-containing protein [Yersinia aleksiciae]CNK59314.1 Protein of uncharacterised function (DUF3757) [Yersinia aleksiciae]
MKYHLSFVLLLTPFSVFATLHCPEIDSISQRGGIYLAATTEGGQWVGTLQGAVSPPIPVKDFNEALLILNSDKSSFVDQGNFQKCTYNLEAEDKQIDMYYENRSWLASISGKPHWVHQKTPLFEFYRCSGVAAEECEFEILPQAPLP